MLRPVEGRPKSATQHDRKQLQSTERRKKKRKEAKIDIIPKVSPQINNLPSTQSNQHPHSPKRKPLNPLIRTLIGIPQPLLASPEILHLINNLTDQLLDVTKVRLDRFELFLSLDAGPVARVSADVDVEFDGAVGVCDGV